METVIESDVKEGISSESLLESNMTATKEEIQDEYFQTTFVPVKMEIHDELNEVKQKSSLITIKQEKVDKLEQISYEDKFKDEDICTSQSQAKEETDNVNYQSISDTKCKSMIISSIDKNDTPGSFDKKLDTSQNAVLLSNNSKELCDNSVYKKEEKKNPIEKRVRCSVCSSLFSKKYFDNHFSIHFNTDKLPCKYCDKEFTDKSGLDIHIENIHYKEKNNICPVCNKKFSKSYKLKCHMRTHDPVKTKERTTVQYFCTSCNKLFATSLENHVRRRHTQCVCNYCQKEFNSLWLLRCHLRIHNDDSKKEKKFVCDECDRNFIKLYKLKQHMQMHIDEQYNCGVCHRQYITKKGLIRHIKLCHIKCICDYCEKEFDSLHLLKSHLHIHDKMDLICKSEH